MRTVARIGLSAAAVLMVAGCQLLPAGQPAITCADVPAAECERQAAAIIADARRDTPDKRSISISRNDGIEVMFSDGTGWSAIP
jgi:hypothetical protein